MGLKLSPFFIVILLCCKIELFFSMAIDETNEKIGYRDPVIDLRGDATNNNDDMIVRYRDPAKNTHYGSSASGKSYQISL